ncbi:MAG: L-idonate 5-dehydrogenase [Friedmanniella sp.]|nr:L-idonate 5-dehydrogenase [Friedmanniella sp.]
MSAQIPDHALGLVAYAAGDVRVEPVPVRRPEPYEAMVEVVYGGICGSDLHYWRHGAAGQSVLREPLLLGHEIVGRVVVAATDGSGPPTGTPVAVHPGRPGPGDGLERFPADRPHLSPAGTYLGSAARLPHTQGGFVRFLPLATTMLRVVSPAVPLRTAALIEPASVAWRALARAGEVRGRRVLVVGAGPIGALVVAVAVRAGAAEVVAVDLHAEPLARVRALGATRTVLATDATAVTAVDADVTVESSGTAAGLGSAVGATTRGGRVVMLGLLPPGDQPVPVAAAIARELELVGSFRFHDEIDAVVAALEDGSLPVAGVVTHTVPIRDAVAALELAEDPVRSGKVLLTFS